MGAWLAKHRLRNLRVGEVPKFDFKGKRVWARVVDVHDGDTIMVVIFLGKRPYKFQLRMMGYDSPEMQPPLDNYHRNEEISAATEAREALRKLANERIFKVDCFGWDKYGRILGELIDPKDNSSINKLMIKHGYGYPYRGKKKHPFQPSKWKPVPP